MDGDETSYVWYDRSPGFVGNQPRSVEPLRVSREHEGDADAVHVVGRERFPERRPASPKEGGGRSEGLEFGEPRWPCLLGLAKARVKCSFFRSSFSPPMG